MAPSFSPTWGAVMGLSRNESISERGKISMRVDFRELRDDVFGHSIAEVFVFFGPAEIFEIEHGDGFLFARGLGRCCGRVACCA